MGNKSEKEDIVLFVRCDHLYLKSKLEYALKTSVDVCILNTIRYIENGDQKKYPVGYFVLEGYDSRKRLSLTSLLRSSIPYLQCFAERLFIILPKYCKDDIEDCRKYLDNSGYNDITILLETSDLSIPFECH